METYFYKDFYGCCASIKHSFIGDFLLTVASSHGIIIHKKVYNTLRGAKIAMGKLSEGWKEESDKI